MLVNANLELINAQRPVSNRRKMSNRHRAKIFAPFAALKGFEESVRKQEIIYEPRRILSDEKQEDLNRKLRLLDANQEIEVTYFVKSPYNQKVGQYHKVAGTVDFFDPSIYLRIGDTEIQLPDIVELSGEAFTILEESC